MEQNINETDNTNMSVTNDNKVPVGLIIFSGLSFIPFIGVIFGFISIVISLYDFNRFKTLFILGLSGMALTLILYFSFDYFVINKRGGFFDNLRVQKDQHLLNEINQEIHVYKCKYGTYPKNVSDLLNINTNLSLKDPIVKLNKNYKGDGLFYYELTQDSFKLFSVGFDGKPFTTDDIYPNKDVSRKVKK